jgi:hypothetical protein
MVPVGAKPMPCADHEFQGQFQFGRESSEE